MIPKEQCYGVIVVYKSVENLFLILQQYDEPIFKGSWTFPKGHHEGNETPKETALRELEEETGITEIELLDLSLIMHEEYKIIKHEKQRLKVNDYFIGFVKDQKVKIQENEISAYKWASYEEAIKTFQYETRKETLKKAKEYLSEYESRK